MTSDEHPAHDFGRQDPLDPVAADPLQEALQLINDGQRHQASVILAWFLIQDPNHERAWHMLSYTLPERDKKIYALQRALQINPGNRAARSELDRLYAAMNSPAPLPLPAARSVVAVPAPARSIRGFGKGKRVVRLSPSLIVGSLIILAFLVAAIAAPLLAPGQGELPGVIPRHGTGVQPEPPGPGHPLGLMAYKYDVFYGLVWGARLAIVLGVVVTVGRVLIGVVLGVLSGYSGGWVDALLMRLTDAFLAFPIVVAAMVGLVVLPLDDAQVVILAFILFGWMPYARLIRGNVLSAREKEYMMSAKATGLPRWRAIFRHLLPNATQGLSALLTADIGGVIVLYAAFTFIGLIGTYSGSLMEANWAQMLEQARDWIIGAPDKPFQYWYTYLPVSLAIVLFSVGWNLVGDGLRDVLDPRLR